VKTNPAKQYISEQMLTHITQSFRVKGLTQTELAREIGKSEAWVSKLLSGKQRTLDPETFRKIEILLEIDFFGVEKNGKISPIAEQIASLVDADPIFARLAICARDAVVGARVAFTPRFVPTEEMAGLGRRILAIAQANPDKPGKVAKLVLQLLA
jgi:transcriptional regulator with XRE-family HTH domain